MQIRLIGGRENRVIEEPMETIAAQFESLLAGTIPCVMIPAGSSYIPSVPGGMAALVVDKDCPGAGTWIYNPEQILPDQITSRAIAGSHGALLGHLESRDTLGTRRCMVVQVVNAAGVVVQDSLVAADDAKIMERQAEILLKRHPGTQVRVVDERQAILTRCGALLEDEQIFVLSEAEGERWALENNQWVPADSNLKKKIRG
jgi:hypothetical protein